MTLRVLVSGGRDYLDRARVFQVLDTIHSGGGGPVVEIIHGAARGADTLAGVWARARGVTETRFAVDHYVDGPWPGAGFQRNERMLRASKPDLAVVFPGGRGTSHMWRICGQWRQPRIPIDWSPA